MFLGNQAFSREILLWNFIVLGTLLAIEYIVIYDFLPKPVA